MKTRLNNLFDSSTALDILTLLVCLSLLFAALCEGSGDALQTGTFAWIMDLTQSLGDPSVGATSGHQLGAQMAGLIAFGPLFETQLDRVLREDAEELATETPVNTDATSQEFSSESLEVVSGEAMTPSSRLRPRRVVNGKRVWPSISRRQRRKRTHGGFDEELWFAEGELLGRGKPTFVPWTLWG